MRLLLKCHMATDRLCCCFDMALSSSWPPRSFVALGPPSLHNFALLIFVSSDPLLDRSLWHINGTTFSRALKREGQALTSTWTGRLRGLTRLVRRCRASRPHSNTSGPNGGLLLHRRSRQLVTATRNLVDIVLFISHHRVFSKLSGALVICAKNRQCLLITQQDRYGKMSWPIAFGTLI